MEEKNKKRQETVDKEMINPLRAEKVRVEFIPKKGGPAGDDPRHIAFGGKVDGVTNRYCLPVLSSTGNFKNALTNSEKEYLEKALNLDINALSVYGDFWKTYYVVIGKEGAVLNLSDASDYLKYKVLLANTDLIAPSLEVLQDKPKTTYEYVLIRDDEEADMDSSTINATQSCWKEYGKIENDADTLRILIEILDAKPYAVTTPIVALRKRAFELINANAKAFLRVASDPMLHTKVIIRRATEIGKVSKRGDMYYLRSDGSPLAGPGEDPTLSVVARWLNQPSNSEMKALLESEVEKARNEKQ